MQKVLDFLEKYCQWVAVGIAAAFFLFALWQFLPGVSEPLSITINGQTFAPSGVDPYILENTVAPLQAAMSGTATFKADVPAYVKDFTTQLDANKPGAPLPAWVTAGNRFKLPEGLNISPDQIGKDDTESGGTRVAVLPAAPAATIEPAASTGFAQVSAAVPAAGTAGTAGAAVAAPTPAPAVAGAAGTAPAVPTRDVTWVRVPYTISLRKMATAFQTVGVPASVSNTRILGVELVRQQQLPGDNWGPEEVVKTLPTVTLRPMPAAGAQPAVLLDYATWADANQQAILQPPFFPFVGGEDPNVLKPAEAPPTADVFDPATYKGGRGSLTDDQWKAVLKARADALKAKQAAAPRPTASPRGSTGSRGPRGGGGRGGPSGPGPGEGAPREALPAAGGTFAEPTTFQNRPSAGVGPYGPNGPRMNPNMPRGGPNGEPMGPNGVADDQGMQPGEPQQPQVGQPIVLPAPPQAPFNPGQAGVTDVQGVAYDVDAKSDATYRYRVRYYLFNPLYQSTNIAANQQLASQFAIVGEDATKWSDPIEIAPLTHFFLTRKPNLTGATVQFNVFRWQNGKVHRVQQSFGPGDSIGKVDGDVDYRTPWTLVEVRQDSSAAEPYVLVMNSEGRLRRQTFTADSASPDQKKLSAEVDAAAGTSAAAGAAAGPGAGANAAAAAAAAAADAAAAARAGIGGGGR